MTNCKPKLLNNAPYLLVRQQFDDDRLNEPGHLAAGRVQSEQVRALGQRQRAVGPVVIVVMVG